VENTFTNLTKKPRICLFTETYYPHIGGGESQAMSLASGLVNKGYDVTILTRRTSPKLKKHELLKEGSVHRIPPFGEKHYKKWGLLITGFPALLTLASQYDVILVSGFRILGVPSVLASKLLGKRCILKADNNGEMSGEYFKGGLAQLGLSPHSKLFKFYLSFRNKILSHANGYIAISRDIASELQNFALKPDQKIYHIPNSVDSNLFCPADQEKKRHLRVRLNLPERGLLVAFSGRLVSYKGLPLLLSVWRDIIIKYPHASLLIVGGGSMDIYNCEREVKDFIKANNLQGCTILTGEVRNVHDYLRASDLFVFPTEKEAFGISLIEAMSCGLPVIATPVGGLKDIVQDSINGLVVNPGDALSLFEALDKLISDETLRNVFGKMGRETVLDRYSTESVTRRYIEVFNYVYNS
jgi:glycosyltransferase involved in cell wall biosynthesis